MPYRLVIMKSNGQIIINREFDFIRDSIEFVNLIMSKLVRIRDMELILIERVST